MFTGTMVYNSKLNSQWGRHRFHRLQTNLWPSYLASWCCCIAPYLQHVEGAAFGSETPQPFKTNKCRAGSFKLAKTVFAPSLLSDPLKITFLSRSLHRHLSKRTSLNNLTAVEFSSQDLAATVQQPLPTAGCSPHLIHCCYKIKPRNGLQVFPEDYTIRETLFLVSERTSPTSLLQGMVNGINK